MIARVLFIMYEYSRVDGTSLVVKWLGLPSFIGGDVGSIPDWGSKIPHASWPSQGKTKVS